jgi:hypothetical protein
LVIEFHPVFLSFLLSASIAATYIITDTTAIIISLEWCASNAEFQDFIPRFNKNFLLYGRVSFSNFVMLAQGGYHLENGLGKFCHMY